jgi:hypothetical protein
MKTLLFTLAIAMVVTIGAGWFTYRAGIAEGDRRCQPCARLEALTELKRVLSKTLYLVTLQDGRLVETRFEVPPKGAFRLYLADIYERLSGEPRGADAAITFRFFVSYSYGFDLNQPYDLRQEGDQLVFQAPPLRMLTCPAVNLGSLQARVDRGSYLVSEHEEKQAIAGKLTEHAIMLGEAALLNPESRKEIRAGAETQLKLLLTSLAGAYGMQVTPGQVRVEYAKEYEAEPWNAEDHAAIRQRLGRYHCVN